MNRAPSRPCTQAIASADTHEEQVDCERHVRDGMFSSLSRMGVVFDAEKSKGESPDGKVCPTAPHLHTFGPFFDHENAQRYAEAVVT